MSSFRIDRQYVTFQAAEIPASKAAHLAPAIVEAAPARDDLLELRAAILAQARLEAEDTLKEAAEKAKSGSELMLKKAGKTAAAIIREAQDKANGVLEAARKEGYAQGLKEAALEAAAGRAEAARELQRLGQGLRENYAALVDGARQDIIQLVLEIVKKIINVKLSESDQVFMGLVNGALEQLKQAGCATIHVCPEDYARYFGNGGQDLAMEAGAHISVVEEAEYAMGDLVVESEVEMLDLSILRQVAKVEQAFLSNGEQ